MAGFVRHAIGAGPMLARRERNQMADMSVSPGKGTGRIGRVRAVKA